METRSKRKATKTKKQKQSNQLLSYDNKHNEVIIEEKCKTKQLKFNNKQVQKTCKVKRKKIEKQVKKQAKNVNGLIIGKQYIPEELLIEILCHVDHETLLICQLVCRHWKRLIQYFVWHKKAEQTIGHILHFDKRTPWVAYYCICSNMPFNKNLIMNHSGESGLQAWIIPTVRNINWFTESPPVPPLPKQPLINGENHCFVTSYSMTWKYQIIDLIEKGFSEYLLDCLQPTITVSEWYSSEDAPALYVCDVELLKDNDERKLILHKEKDGSRVTFYHSYTFSKIIKNGEQNKWFKHEHQFKNYGKGLRKIKYIHGGRAKHRYDENHGNYGSKMSRACIQVHVPSLDYHAIVKLPNYY